jgi:hypothetical protein
MQLTTLRQTHLPPRSCPAEVEVAKAKIQLITLRQPHLPLSCLKPVEAEARVRVKVKTPMEILLHRHFGKVSPGYPRLGVRGRLLKRSVGYRQKIDLISVEKCP